jgi:hypothetical protein
MQAVALTNTSIVNKRRELDYYPTPPDVTLALLQFLNLSKDLVIWEPACGEGHMANVIKQWGCKVQSSDIRDTGYGEGHLDFLTATRNADAIITNPPFALSEAFIRHGIAQASIVAMLLKSQYWHAQKRAMLFQEYPPSWVLPLTWRPDFMFGERGGAPTMECLWSVWIAGEKDTRYRLLQKPDYRTWLKEGGV